MSESIRLDPDNIPKHIAIIMDGNGRWAQQRGLPRAMGHKSGVTSVQDVVRHSAEIGVEVLTLYAFSTENWNRPALEVHALMGLLKNYLQSELDNLLKNNISLRCIGQIEKMPSEVSDILKKTIKMTANNRGLVLNLALSYGARSEIVTAVRNIAAACVAKKITVDDISEELIGNNLYTAGLPDPDLLIRTGGESRLSNFLLWQASYAEIYITETLWPDFREKGLVQAIDDYQKRQRRFGKTGEQVMANQEAS